MAKRSGASVLKSKGVIPAHWDLRKPTNYQKRVISRREKEYSELIKNPQGFKVSKVAKTTAQLLKASGYKVENGRAIIPTRGNKVRIKGDKLIIDRGDRTETVYLNSGKGFLQRVERELKKEENEDYEGLPDGEYWAFKVGDNNTFLSNWQQGMTGLMRYGQKVNFTDPSAAQYTNLVKIKFKDKNHMQSPKPKAKPRKRKPNNKRGK